MIYIFVYSIISIFSIFSINIKKDQRKNLAYLGGLIILIFQSLRWRTGTDWEPYLNEFYHVDLSGNNDDFEFGYRFLNYFCREVFGSYTAFLFIECGLNLLFILLFVNKIGKLNPCLGLLYFFSLAIFPIRFSLASSIVVYSYCFIVDRKLIKFLLVVFLAFSIHRSAILFLPMYFICQKEYSLKVYLSVYLGALILGIAAEYTFGNLLSIASIMYGSMDNAVQGKMEEYITGEIPEAAEMSPLRYALSLINSTFFIMFFYWFKKKFFNNNRTYSIIFTLYVFGISFNRIFLTTIPDIARATSYFTGGFIIMIIYILFISKNIFVRILTTTIICAYLAINYCNTINGYYIHLFIPYYSIFDTSYIR